MVTTPVTCLTTQLAATLVAVTFGWTPVSDSTDGGVAKESGVEQAGYEYQVRLTPADLDALRDGRSDSLSSALPKDLGNVERVRITVGEGPAPRLLASTDQDATQQRELEPVRRTVAKPVVPDWPDAAELAGKRRTAYQNPLQEGFESGVRPLEEAAEWTRNQTGAAAQRLKNSVGQTGDTLRNTTKELLEGTGRALNDLVPGAERRTDQFGRPLDQYGRPLYSANDERATPPLPTGAQQTGPLPVGGQGQGGFVDDRIDPTTAYERRNSLPLREPSQPASARDGFENPLYGNDNRNYPEERGPAFGGATNGDRSGSILKSFAEDDGYRGYTNNQSSRPLVDVPRRQAQPAQFADNARPATRDDFYENNRSVGRPEYPDAAPSNNGSNFPDLPSDRSFSDRSDFVNESPRTPDTRTVANRGVGSSWVNGYGDDERTDADRQTNAENGQTNNGPSNDSSYFEKLLLVILGAVTCFTWIAYIDVRNKYRMALRGVPTAGFGHGVAA